MPARWTTVLGVVFFAALAAAEQPPVFKNLRERTSYALGVEAGRGFSSRAIDLDPEAFAKGLKYALSGGTPLLTDDQVRAAIAELQAAVKRREIEGRRVAAGETRKSAGAFLAENAKKSGVVTLPSGLQYRILKHGSGSTPTDGDTVECTYRGSLINGLEFDSSSRGGSSPTIVICQSISGLREALKLMPVGSTWQIFVPPTLTSGSRGATMVIPPNEVLIYEVELLAVK